MTVRVKGLNGATVANNTGAGAPFESEFVTQEIAIVRGDGGTELTPGAQPLKFKAPSSAQESQNLIKATREDWNANLDRIFNAHSGPLDTVKATFATEVVPL